MKGKPCCPTCLKHTAEPCPQCGEQWPVGTREAWRSVPIPGFEFYEVSNLGRLRGFRRTLIKPTVNDDHYRYVKLKNHGVVRSMCLHRLVYLAFEGPLPEGWEIHHDDRNRANNCQGNLVGCEEDADHWKHHKPRPEPGRLENDLCRSQAL